MIRHTVEAFEPGYSMMAAIGSQLDDWLARLETLSPKAVDLGLERVETVLDRLALQMPPCVLHVAGTNGKGSCVAMLQALLSASGIRVGSYTSPHILRFNERIAIDGVPATDAEITGAFERVEAVRGDVRLTYFEFGTLAALSVFADRDVGTAVLEVGMGGRLDAVNAVAANACLITNVSLDHCDWLGEDVETIALEKAGIMRAGRPAVYGSADVPQSILTRARQVGAPLLLAGRDFRWSRDADAWSWTGREHRLAGLKPPALQGQFQLDNAASVLALVEAAGFGNVLDVARINAVLPEVRLPGRLQQVSAGGSWVLDVAHNPAAAAMLAATLRARRFDGRTIGIIGMLDDKDVAGVVAPLVEVVDSWIAVTAETPRAIPAIDLARDIANLANCACLIAESLEAAIEHARNTAGPADRILVTGSFYLVGPVLRELELYSLRPS